MNNLQGCGSEHGSRHCLSSANEPPSLVFISAASQNGSSVNSPHTPCSTCGKTPHCQTCSSGPGLPAASSPTLSGPSRLTFLPLLDKKPDDPAESTLSCVRLSVPLSLSLSLLLFRVSLCVFFSSLCGAMCSLRPAPVIVTYCSASCALRVASGFKWLLLSDPPR